MNRNQKENAIPIRTKKDTHTLAHNVSSNLHFVVAAPAGGNTLCSSDDKGENNEIVSQVIGGEFFFIQQLARRMVSIKESSVPPRYNFFFHPFLQQPPNLSTPTVYEHRNTLIPFKSDIHFAMITIIRSCYAIVLRTGSECLQSKSSVGGCGSGSPLVMLSQRGRGGYC